MQGLSALRHMDLQGNQLSRLEDLNLLRKYVCCLTHLDLRGNLLARAPSYAPLALRRLPHLATLDGRLLGGEDWEHAAASHGLLTVPMLEQCASTCLLSIWSTPGKQLSLLFRLSDFDSAKVMRLYFCWTIVSQPSACIEHNTSNPAHTSHAQWHAVTTCCYACAQCTRGQDTCDVTIMPRPCNHTYLTRLVCSQCLLATDTGQPGVILGIELTPKGIVSFYLLLTADGQAGPKPAAWWGHVVELRMADQGLRRIQGLDQLTALRKACFAHNEISHVQGLEACTALQELSFEVSESPQLHCSGSYIVIGCCPHGGLCIVGISREAWAQPGIISTSSMLNGIFSFLFFLLLMGVSMLS